MSTVVLAQPAEVNARRFMPPMHVEGSPGTESPEGPGAWRPHVGAWGSYARQPIQVESYEGDVVATPLEQQWLVDVFASLGLGSHATLGLNLPIVVSQDGDPPAAWGATGSAPSKRALGDLALKGKLLLFEHGSDDAGETANVGLLGWVNLPTGSDDWFASDRAVSAEIRGLGSYDLGLICLRAALGGYWRSATRYFLGDGFGSALVWGASAMLRSASHHESKTTLGVTGELRGDVSMTPELAALAASPVVAGLFLRYRLAGLGFFTGAELPLNQAVGNPGLRAIAGLDWVSVVEDADQDGISDPEDLCPGDPEDVNGFEDTDGCPDQDVDADGVADVDDKCRPPAGGSAQPRHVEDKDGYQDADGCPEHDNDADGILDAADACPDSPGPALDDASRSGCPRLDRDQDGVFDDVDLCVEQPEDLDGVRDTDGCPDLDNDEDSIPDSDDACPLAPGAVRYPLTQLGCPDRDADGDTYLDTEDGCPQAAEDFDGFEDLDGCPEQSAGEPLAKIAVRDGVEYVRLTPPPQVVIDEKGDAVVDTESLPQVRALAQLLKQRSESSALIVRRPAAGASNSAVDDHELTQALAQRVNELAQNEQAALAGHYAELTGLPQGRSPWVVILRRRDVTEE